MNICPHCHRRLLTHTSASCNWCGQEIGDAAYQQQADAERQAFFAHQAQRDAQSLAIARAANVGAFADPLGDPVMDMMLLANTRRENAPNRAVEAARQAAMAEAERERLEDAERVRAAKAAEERALREAEPSERFRHLEL